MRLDEEAGAALERARDCLQEVGVPLFIEVAEAPPEAEGAVESLSPGEIAHVPVLPRHFQTTLGRLPSRILEEWQRDVYTRDAQSQRRQLEREPPLAAWDIQDRGLQRKL